MNASLIRRLFRCSETGRVQITLPPIGDMRKWMIEQQLDEILLRTRIYKLDISAADNGHEIVRLRPYHCHLNPIEFVWKDIKHEVKRQNTEQKIDKIKLIAETEFNKYGAAKIKPHWEHVNRLRRELWEEDGHCDKVIAPLIITDDDDDDDDDEDDMFSEDEEEYPIDDNASCLDSSWVMDDGIDLERDIFAEESSYLEHMSHGHPKKRGRTCPGALYGLE